MSVVQMIVPVMLAGLLTENMILTRFLGICPFLGVSQKLSTAVSMSAAVTLVMVLSTAATYPIYLYLLLPRELEYLQTLVFILIIASLVQLAEIVLKKIAPPIYSALGVYLPLITTNCVVLGITMLNFTDPRIINFPLALLNALFSGLGFMLAMVLFSGVRGRTASSDIPEPLKGLPITLIAASIVSLSFLGFKGMV